MRSLNNFFGKPVKIENVDMLYPLSIYDYVEHLNLFGVLQITVKLYLQSIDDKDKDFLKQIENNVYNFDIIKNSDIQNKNNLVELLKLSFKKQNIKFLKLSDMKIYDENNKRFVYNISCIKNFFNINKVDNDDEVIDFYNEIINKDNVDKDYEFISIDDCKSIIDRNNYDYIRNQIIRINAIRLPKQAKTRELQKWYDKAYKFKQINSKEDYEDMLSTIARKYHKLPEELEHLTPYQVNVLYARDIKVSEFKTGVSYRCSPNFKDVEIKNYNEHIDLLEDVKISSDFNTFRRRMRGMLSK